MLSHTEMNKTSLKEETAMTVRSEHPLIASGENGSQHRNRPYMVCVKEEVSVRGHIQAERERETG